MAAVSGKKGRVSFLNVAAYGLLLLVAIVMVFPFYWMITASLKTAAEVLQSPPTLWPSDPQWSNYADVFRDTYDPVTQLQPVPFAQQYFNTLYISVLNVIGVVAVATLAGYAFARIRFPGRTLLLVALLSALLMPVSALLIPLYIIYRDLGWLGTHLPLIVEPAVGAAAILGTFVMRQYFLSLPIELEDAARIDGLGRLGIVRHIALPLAGPAVATVVILTWLASWNMFIEPLVFVGAPNEALTAAVGLTQYTTPSNQIIYQVQLAATTLTVLPVLLVFVIAQRRFIQGIARVGINA